MILRNKDSRLAQHWKKFNDKRVECNLCPRHCRPKLDAIAYCGVRGNVNNTLHTFNYGKALAATEEIIETEAINHYRPGARILSMGNIGCMMSCSFCQNWETSQVKHLDQRIIRHYSAQQTVDICLKNNIEILSWTYNDPVVWQEFVVETSKLAQAHGIKTLYKSALYIEQQPLEELIDCIDIFSISLKSMSQSFYKKITRARLEPILERIKQIANSDRHLEISQLIIPELNDKHADIKRTVNWIQKYLGENIALHFVGFHPAYKYTHVKRTELNTLIDARKLAETIGIRHVYLGNTYQAGLNDSRCTHCDALLVRRYGLHVQIEHLDQQSNCTKCGTASPIIEPLHIRKNSNLPAPQKDFTHRIQLQWSDEVQSAHVIQTKNIGNNDVLRLHPLGGVYPITERSLQHGLDRFIVSRHSENEKGIVISWNSNNEYQLLPVLDRAHFPVQLDTETQKILLSS